VVNEPKCSSTPAKDPGKGKYATITIFCLNLMEPILKYVYYNMDIDFMTSCMYMM